MLLRELTVVVTRARQLELAGFAALGSRQVGEDAALAVYLAGASRAHGFRAGLLETCLPVASGYVAEDVAPSGAVISEVVAASCADGGGRGTFDALVGVFYPELRDAYEQLRVGASGPGDTFCRRTFRRCRDDVAGMLEEAVALGAPDSHGACAQRVRVLLGDNGGLAAILRATEARGDTFVPGQAPGGAA